MFMVGFSSHIISSGNSPDKSPSNPSCNPSCLPRISQWVARTTFLFACSLSAACWHGQESSKSSLALAQPSQQFQLSSELSVHIGLDQVDFMDYLPASPAPKKQHCKIQQGIYAVKATPWKVAERPFVFVNFAAQPPGCTFATGYVAFGALAKPLSIQDPNTSAAVVSNHLANNLSKNSPATDLGEHLSAYYAQEGNYQSVRSQVFAWYGEKKNGCVAFAATALRAIGIAIPLADTFEEDLVALDTKPFVHYLLEKMHWQRIEDLNQARPGDIGVTIMDAEFKEYPTHIFVFARWLAQDDLVALVLDNQGYLIPRPLRSTPANAKKYPDKDPTAFLIRPRHQP